MLCYSNDDHNLRCEFTASAPGTAPDWGTWQKTGLVYTNHGPQLRRPSSVQTKNSGTSGKDGMELVSDEYSQSVFIRYFTMRKRLGVPRIIKAGAGPHDLERRGRDDDELSLEAPYSSDPESDPEASTFDSDEEDDGCSVTSLEAESDILVYNVAADGRDDFDVAADYIFENSDAESVLLHHRDIALVRERGDGGDLATLLFERSPAITVDSNGVGMIESRGVSPAETRRLDWVTTPTLPFNPSEGGQETENEGGLSEPRPLTHSERAELEGSVCGAHTVDYILATTTPRRVEPTHDHSSYDKTTGQLSDTRRGGRKAKSSVKLTPVEAKTPGSEPPDIGERAVALANRLQTILAFPQPVQSMRFLCPDLLGGKCALSLVSLPVVTFGVVCLQWHLWGYLRRFSEVTDVYIGSLTRLTLWDVEGESSILAVGNLIYDASGHIMYIDPYTNVPTIYNSGDVFWILASTALTWLVIPGVGFFYSGLLWRKNALSLISLSVAVLCVVSSEWFFWGYSPAFSNGANAYIGGLKHFALIGVEGQPSIGSPRISSLVLFIYKCMFAAITAVAERGHLGPVLLLAFIWSTIVYGPLPCMTWNFNGRSLANGGLDFGKCSGHWTERFAQRPRNTSYVVLGTVLLWFGWFGFNGGSALAANSRAASVYIVTNLAAAVGGITRMLWDYRSMRKWSVIGFCSGAVSGLVAIIPASGYVGSVAAALFGVVAGTVCSFAAPLGFALGYDDYSGTLVPYTVGGVVGSLLTGLFAQTSIANLDGITVDKNYIQLALRLADLATAISYSFAITMMTLWVMHFIPFRRLRIDEILECVGGDQPQMDKFAYDYVGPDSEVS